MGNPDPGNSGRAQLAPFRATEAWCSGWRWDCWRVDPEAGHDRLLEAWEVRAQAEHQQGLPVHAKPASALSRSRALANTESWVKSLTRRIMKTMVH